MCQTWIVLVSELKLCCFQQGMQHNICCFYDFVMWSLRKETNVKELDNNQIKKLAFVWHLISGVIRSFITLVFHVKAQSCAMGNTTDKQWRLNLHSMVGSTMSKFDAKRKIYFEYDNGAFFFTFKHSDPHTVCGRSTLKDGIVNECVFWYGSFCKKNQMI